jgi:CRISPR-associated protein Csb1
MALTLSELSGMVAKDVAIRGSAILEPAGGPGDKVFPPSHSIDQKHNDPGAKYAFETRRIGGADVRCVLLDSVQSQANRMEEALQALWADGRIRLPVIAVDFSSAEGLQDLGCSITSLTAPHRIADALLRDSMLDRTLFRYSKLGQSFTDATMRDASALFRTCPTGLVFGIWDSTGPKGGLGAKFARALVSEIVGVNAVAGTKTSSRIDPTGIVKKAAEIYAAASETEGWTHDPGAARIEKRKPVKFGNGRPSEVNHSNIPPTVDDQAGGVTIDFARHTVVLSLAALRKIGFGDHAAPAERARAVLAALSLVAVLSAQERGHDLRSRCLLVPRKDNGLKLEIVSGDGSTRPMSITMDEALKLYADAVKALPGDIAFPVDPGAPIAKLVPSEKLAHLIRESRKLAAVGEGDEAG